MNHNIVTNSKESPEAGKKRFWFNPWQVSRLKKFWNAQRLTSLIALLISVGTFITFAYQNHLIQKQQYRSVLPYLMFSFHTDQKEQGQRTISLQLFNNGIGPAIIEDIRIFYNGNEYRSIQDFFIHGVYAENKINTSRTELMAGFAIPAGQFHSLLSSNDSEATKVLEKVFFSDSFVMEIEYSSLYEEKWKTIYKNGDYNPKPVKIE